MVPRGMYSEGQVHHRYTHVRGLPGSAAIAARHWVGPPFHQEGDMMLATAPSEMPAHVLRVSS
jgi:hypothetical protein